MSLLIDALKQAEATRKQAKPATTQTPDSPSLSLVDELAEGRNAQTIEQERASLRSNNTSTAQRQAAARELFDVKHEPSRLPVLLAILALCASVVGGAYVWWEKQTHSLQTGTGFSARPLAQTPITTPPPTNTVQPPAAAAKTQITATTEGRISLGPMQKNAEAAPSPRARTKADSTTEHQATDQEDASSESPSIRRRPQSIASVSPLTASAYQAYIAGNVALSRTRYRDALRQEPNNVEAMIALATIAQREGRTSEAERLFSNVLAVNPREATALSQLAMLNAEMDPSLAENRLRQLAADQPSVASTFFALGSLYAQQRRWKEAQQAFFQAHTLDTTNADTLYNLAVSLDHLGQAPLAARYYEKAAQIALPNVSAFDLETARKRALTLSTPDTNTTAEAPSPP